MLIFGLDTVVDPSSIGDGDLREKAKELYRKWFKDLVDQCDKCRDLDLASACDTDIVILPGKGRFYGWEFRGSVAHLFNKAFVNVLDKLSNRYSFVALDLTHGINFQLVSVLYATIASIVLKNMEKDFLILNSEPVVRGSKKCIIEQTTTPPLDKLGIMDVSKLHQAMMFIRTLAHLKNLSTKPVEQFVGKLRREDRRELAEVSEATELMERLIPFFKLIENGAYGSTYVESFVEADGREEPLKLNPCMKNEMRASFSLREFEYEPKVDNANKVIDYEPTSISKALRVALNVFLDDVCNELQANDFISYLDRIANYHGSKGHLYGQLIASETRDSVSTIAKYIVKCIHNLPEEYVKMNDELIVVDVVLFRALMQKLKEVREAIKVGKCLDLSYDYINSVRSEQVRDVTMVRSMKSVGPCDRRVRHMLAHGGLEYVTLKRIVIAKRKSGKTEIDVSISKIVYDREILSKILSAIDVTL